MWRWRWKFDSRRAKTSPGGESGKGRISPGELEFEVTHGSAATAHTLQTERRSHPGLFRLYSRAESAVSCFGRAKRRATCIHFPT